jgi:DNA polymerase-3 subunit epsilon/ATP-dependent DNA helicase DinG
MASSGEKPDVNPYNTERIVMEEPIYVALDLEMTGLEVGQDEIIEIGAIKFQEHKILDGFKTFIKPQRSLPLKITRITGITEEHLKHAPTFNEIAADLARFIGNHPLIGHSFFRDKAMLEAQGMHIPQPVYDTFDMATLLLPHVSTYKLITLAEYFTIPFPDAHRAYNDADISRQVFLRLYQRIKRLDLDELINIGKLMAQTEWYLGDLFIAIQEEKTRTVFQQHISGEQKPTPLADDETMPMLWDEQAQDRERGWLRPTGYTAPLDEQEIAAFFARDGAISYIFEHYEQRPQQVQMAQEIARTFNTSEALLVEAGTGTGKSMAYLLPAALYATKRGERVVVSTNTINLQDQLFFKDIPDLQRIIHTHYASNQADTSAPEPTPFTATLLKGRSNYLCLQRYNRMLAADNKLTPDEARLLLKVHFWKAMTTSGDGSEMLLSENERKAWSSINVPADTCLGKRCPDFDACYFFHARQAAEAAHIVVVNHALMLADIAVESGVLPPYDHLIVDEAHTLEDVATDQLSFMVDQETLVQYLESLSTSSADHEPAGLLSRLQTSVQTSGIADRDVRDQLTAITREMPGLLTHAQKAIEDSFSKMIGFVVKEQESSKGGQDNIMYDVRLRITPSVRRKDGWEDVTQTWENIRLALQPIGESLGKLHTLFTDIEAMDLTGYDEMLLQIQASHRYNSDVLINLDYLMTGNEEKICWLTLDRSRDTLKVYVAPLNVAPMLSAQLFEQKQTIILTSATLSINESFSFIKSRIGLEEAAELYLDSPFDYESQALVYIPNDIPEPNQRGYQPKVEEALIQLCTATGGRTLALFTANSAIRRTRTGIQDALEDQDIIVLGQGVDGSRRHILEQFKEWSRTVLLGTSSFWQGIDVVGDALSVLVIAKLPFQVPTDPIFAARSEQFSDPFHQYAVPNSILRFKQGFGRLIRSKQDRGIVVVLDRRLLSKRYGAEFLQSLPSTSVREGPLKHLPTIATRFLGSVLDE